eukprot:UN16531
MALGDEIVVRGDPEDEPEEEEDEEDLVDPQDTMKESCTASGECQKYLAEYESCTERVNSKENTSETCAQELYDFMHCVDYCVAKSLFTQIK